MVWQDIIGNRTTKVFLQKLLVAKRRPHAVLLAGPGGIGKRSLAGVFTAALLCGQGDSACGQCINCRRLREGSHPDYFFIQPELKKDSEVRKDSIGIDQIKDLIREAAFQPRLSEQRVAVVDGMELLTVQASNSLLKLLEDPPANWIFVLTADASDKLLPTILSRVVTLDMQPLSEEEIVVFLTEKGVSAETARAAAALADGSPGRALQYSDPGILEKREEALFFLRCTLTGKKEVLFDGYIEKIEREQALLICEFIVTLARDAWQVRLGRLNSVWHKEKETEIRELLSVLSIKNLELIVKNAQDTWAAIKNAANIRLAMEGLYIALTEVE